MDELDADLPLEVPAALTAAVVAGTRTGHSIAAEKHDPDEGFDSYTFGYVRYRLSWHWIEAELRAAGFRVERVDQTLRCWWGAHEFSFYNGGDSLAWNIESYDFDRSQKRSLIAMRNEQLSLFTDLVPPIDVYRELTFVLVGNPESGCEAVYLGAPIQTATGCSWAWVRRVYRFDGAERAEIAGSPKTQTTRFSELPAAVVFLELLESDASAEGS